MFCANTKCPGNFCLHKRTFQSLGTNDYQWLQCAAACQVRNISFESQASSIFLTSDQGVYILEKSPKLIQDVIGDVCRPEKYCFNRKNFELFDGYVTTDTSIYGSEKCGAWFFLDKIFLRDNSTQTRRKQTKHSFFAEKRMKVVPHKQLFNNVPFRSTIWRKKELCVDNKVQETTGNVQFRTCKNERCVYISTNTTSSFYDCKNCKAWCQVLNVPSWTKNWQLCCFAPMALMVFSKRRVMITKLKGPLLF